MIWIPTTESLAIRIDWEHGYVCPPYPNRPKLSTDPDCRLFSVKTLIHDLPKHNLFRSVLTEKISGKKTAAAHRPSSKARLIREVHLESTHNTRNGQPFIFRRKAYRVRLKCWETWDLSERVLHVIALQRDMAMFWAMWC
jgi:hypothetical protein